MDYILSDISKRHRIFSGDEKTRIELMKFKRCFWFVRLIDLHDKESSKLLTGGEESEY